MNINAVARLANVSTATVSRTINGLSSVSPATAERVRNAIEQLQYQPNTNARALGTGRSHLLGLIISDITNPFFPELVKAFEDIAAEHGQEVLIANTNYDVQRMESCINRMLQRQVDGVAIMTSQTSSDAIAGLSRRGIPVVFLDSGRVSPGISTINVDYEVGIELAMEHLFQLGHRRISFISGPSALKSARIRSEAFRKGRELHGLKLRRGWTAEGNHQIDGGYAAMKGILDASRTLKSGPTSVIASNDLTAIGAINALHHRGLRVPEDFSVVGFDDIQLSTYTMPSLSTIHLPRVLIAETAFRALFTSEQRKGYPLLKGSAHRILPHLVMRESTTYAPKTR